MALDIHVLPAPEELPKIEWRWDTETGILSGGFMPQGHSTGYTGTVELSDDDGSTVVLEIGGGVLCGLDLVVWPELESLPGLAVPVETRIGTVIVPSKSARRGMAALEFDTTLSVSADNSESVFHLRIGTRRPVEPVRVAEGLVVEVDAASRLAGFWLEGVPSTPDP